MPLRLYRHPLSSFCHKAIIAFYEKDIPFEPVMVDFGDPASRATFEAVWPAAKMPVLRDEDRDATVAEATAIIEYLDLFHPGRMRLLPAEPQRAWRARMWDRVFDLHLHTAMQKIVGDAVRPTEARDPHGVDRARRDVRTAYALLEDAIAGNAWFLGDDFTLVDCAAAPALFYANTIMPLGPSDPRLTAYLARLMARPSIARVLREAEPYFGMFPLDPKSRIALHQS